MAFQKTLLLTATALLVTTLPGFALAKDGGEHHGSKKPAYSQQYRHDDRENVVVQINAYDRKVIREYMRDDYRRNCPPGLAKKHNGCMPPGKAKKWRAGYNVPKNTVIMPITRELRSRLNPVPRGYEYVHVDKDILLISTASHKIIDAVTLLSAIGK